MKEGDLSNCCQIENLKQKLQRLSTIITDLWDIFPEETQEELNILLESEEEWQSMKNLNGCIVKFKNYKMEMN